MRIVMVSVTVMISVAIGGRNNITNTSLLPFRRCFYCQILKIANKNTIITHKWDQKHEKKAFHTKILSFSIESTLRMNTLDNKSVMWFICTKSQPLQIHNN